jgi:RAB protein geranylgeranyltransferase component A
VLHLDPNELYGAQDAAFNLQELLVWACAPDSTLYSQVECSHTFEELPVALQQLSRRFAIALAPVLVPAISPFVDALISSGVSNYAGFKLLESLALVGKDSLRRIPTSKEEVFKSTDMSLIEKRRLMKFLQFATSDFSANPVLASFPSIQHLLKQQFRLEGSLLDAAMYGFMACQSAEGA